MTLEALGWNGDSTLLLPLLAQIIAQVWPRLEAQMGIINRRGEALRTSASHVVVKFLKSVNTSNHDAVASSSSSYFYHE